MDRLDVWEELDFDPRGLRANDVIKRFGTTFYVTLVSNGYVVLILRGARSGFTIGMDSDWWEGCEIADRGTTVHRTIDVLFPEYNPNQGLQDALKKLVALADEYSVTAGEMVQLLGKAIDEYAAEVYEGDSYF